MMKFAGMEYDDLVYACALGNAFSTRPSDALSIMEHFGSPREIFELSAGELTELFGKGSAIIDAILDKERLERAEKEVGWARSHGIEMIFFKDNEYPKRLRECKDAPVLLYKKGNADLNGERTVAIVGTRKASRYGLEQCRKIVETFSELSTRPVVISGLAYGIDICAHRSALEYGLETIGIMATGMDRIYPAVHRNDAVRITGHGCLLTDFPAGTNPVAFNFIRRNRIIAGMSDAVIVLESGAKGGSMITANMGISYSREIFALPGRITDPCSAGCNLLIEKNAAWAISSPESLVRNLGWGNPDKKTRKKRWEQIFENCDSTQRNILLALSVESPLGKDSLIEKNRGDAAATLAGLTWLEMEDAIETDLYGNYYLK